MQITCAESDRSIQPLYYSWL